MLSAGVAADAGQHRLIVSFDEMQAPIEVRLHQRDHVIRIDSAVPGVGRAATFGRAQIRARVRLPRLAGVVLVLVLLDPYLRLGEKIDPAGMVPMRVREDDVRHILRLDSELAQCVRRFHELLRLPLAQ